VGFAPVARPFLSMDGVYFGRTRISSRITGVPPMTYPGKRTTPRHVAPHATGGRQWGTADGGFSI
jgi:hypothetical protein